MGSLLDDKQYARLCGSDAGRHRLALVDAAADDPDGAADPGEIVRDDVSAQNVGWGSATGVLASLGSTTDVTVLHGPVVFPSLAAGETVRIRWRLLCDLLGAGAGWWIDDVQVEPDGESCDGL